MGEQQEVRGLGTLLFGVICLVLGFVAGVKYERDYTSDQLRFRITRDGDVRIEGTGVEKNK
jgi:hypothetical protein